MEGLWCCSYITTCGKIHWFEWKFTGINAVLGKFFRQSWKFWAIMLCISFNFTSIWDNLIDLLTISNLMAYDIILLSFTYMENDANILTPNIHGHLSIYFHEYISKVDSVKVKFKVSTRFPSKTIYWYRESNLS